MSYVWPEPFAPRLVPIPYKYKMGLSVIFRDFFVFDVKFEKTKKIFSTSPTKVNLSILMLIGQQALVDPFFYFLHNHQNMESQEIQVCQSNQFKKKKKFIFHNKNNTTEVHQISIKIITFGSGSSGGFTIGVVGVQALKKANDYLGMGNIVLMSIKKNSYETHFFHPNSFD